MAEVENKLATLSQLKSYIDSKFQNSGKKYEYISNKRYEGSNLNPAVNLKNIQSRMEGFTYVDAGGVENAGLQVDSTCILLVKITAANAYRNPAFGVYINEINVFTVTPPATAREYMCFVSMDPGDFLSIHSNFTNFSNITITGV